MVVETVDDVLVVVNSDICCLVKTGLLWCFQVADVKDVGHGVLISSWAGEFLLINLIVEEEELLPVLVVDPSLMSVGSSLVLELLSATYM